MGNTHGMVSNDMASLAQQICCTKEAQKLSKIGVIHTKSTLEPQGRKCIFDELIVIVLVHKMLSY